LRIDWSKVIGKWFPWTLNEDSTDAEKDKI
jgi:hypothetical protein